MGFFRICSADLFRLIQTLSLIQSFPFAEVRNFSNFGVKSGIRGQAVAKKSRTSGNIAEGMGIYIGQAKSQYRV
jgi:hypothetical protein